MSGGAVRRYDALPSTQLEAVRLAREGAPPGTTLVARVQSRGIGRGDHRWASPEGGLYLSRIVADPRGRSALLPMATGVALGDALASALGVGTRLRWPNDLIEAGGDRKLAGTIADRVDRPDGGAVAVVGVGINVTTSRASLPEALRSSAAILEELAPGPVTLARVEGLAARAVDAAAARLAEADGDRAVVRDAQRRLHGLGREVWIDGVRAGRVVGLDDDGALRTEDDRGPRRTLAGSLSYAPPLRADAAHG